MKTPAWTKAVKHAADPQRAAYFLEVLSATSARAALAHASDEKNARERPGTLLPGLGA